MKITAENMNKMAKNPPKTRYMYCRKEYKKVLNIIKEKAKYGQLETIHYTMEPVFLIQKLLIRRKFKVVVTSNYMRPFKLEISWN